MENCELENFGLSAYASGDYALAIQCLARLSRSDYNSWQARLYLAMAYCRESQHTKAMQEFKEIADWCPDQELQLKAQTALRGLNAQVQAQFWKAKPTKSRHELDNVDS